MSISELGALGEFIGSIAVLITLVYLAMQVRQTKRGLDANTTALLGASEVNGNESTINTLIALWSNESMVDLTIRASRSVSELSIADRVRIGAFYHAGFQTHQITFLQWKKRLLDDEYWAFCIRWFGSLQLSQPGIQQWWALNNEAYTREYRDLIDTVIADQGWNDASKYL
jgi:hypothetical protein